MLIVSSKQMKEIEENSLNYDLTLPRLMENAGSAAAAAISKKYDVDGIGCVVFSGSGNNGGDGFVVARRLYEQGAHVLLALVNGEPATPQAKQMFDFLSVLEIPVLSIDSDLELIKGYSMNADLIIDAIFGMGFRGELTDNSLLACGIIASSPAPVVALDTPSGIESDSGLLANSAVKAQLTIAFQFLKPLHILPSSVEHCGEIVTVDIGIPKEVYSSVRSRFNFITESRILETLPLRTLDGHKGLYGRLLCICGSSQYRGAATLAATAAYRSGVGLCCVSAPEVVCQSVATHLPEAVFQPLPQTATGAIDFRLSLPLLEKELTKSSAVLFGCGFGDDPSGVEILEFLISSSKKPLIIDADGLNILSNNMDLLYKSSGKIVLTPHPGEMARLTNTSIAKVQSDRINTASNLACKFGVFVVLKGTNTLIATPDKEIYINETGGPGLSKAGSGDLLAGMIGSFIAQGMSILDATSSATWLHGTAGERCGKRKSTIAMLPHEILEDLSDILLDAETM